LFLFSFFFFFKFWIHQLAKVIFEREKENLVVFNGKLNLGAWKFGKYKLRG
jgi:hypothetical protein